jgi:hypothetical protein
VSGFDDNQEAVPIVDPRDVSPTAEQRIAAALDAFALAAGIVPSAPVFREAFEALRAVMVRERTEAAAEALHEAIWHRIPEGPAATALRRILVGPTCPCREDARLSGCSHVAILKAEKRLRELFRLPPTPLLVER